MRARIRLLVPPRPSHLAADGSASDEAIEAETFEWRMRETDGPVDLGHYSCACGFQFRAPVDTTVRCPHCGSGQAW